MPCSTFAAVQWLDVCDGLALLLYASNELHRGAMLLETLFVVALDVWIRPFRLIILNHFCFE